MSKNNNYTVHHATSVVDFEKCFDVIHVLRPHIEREGFNKLISDMVDDGYHLIYIEEDGRAVSACGYRYLNFLFLGQHIYIDDLSTLPQYRGNGYAGALLDHTIQLAREKELAAVTLDSGHHRSDAHRLYLNKRFKISSHHFVLRIEEE